MMGVAEAGTLDRERFRSAFGMVFEDSPWVADAAWERRPFADVEALHSAMVAAVAAAPEPCRLGLLRAHPDLAGRAALARTLTAASAAEQAGAGLDRLDPARFERLHALNRAYAERFGFPYVVCVREHTVDSILADAEERLTGRRETELDRALAEVAKIARLRLDDLVRDGAPA